MNQKVLGGLQIRTYAGNDLPKSLQTLGEVPYQYRMIRLAAGDSVTIEGGMAHCLHLYAGQGERVQLSVGGQTAAENQTVWIKSPDAIVLKCKGGSCLALLGSLKVAVISKTEVQVFGESQVKKVSKPWGYELWLTGDPSPYFAFKRIFIKAGTKTSLQYHAQKRETNFLLEGQAGLHYNPDPKVPANQFKTQSAVMATLDPYSVIDVFPNHVHRLEAVSDILLCEVSTPELDDVVRISDDSGRKDGRIDSEHKVV